MIPPWWCGYDSQVEDAITMYQDHHRWEDAIRVAESAHHSNAPSLKLQYLQWLLETGQEEQAGAVKEREGDYLAAIGLYLKGGLPGRAAQVVMSVHNVSWDPALMDSILASLAKAGLYERAGEMYENMGRSTEAMQSYRRGHAYRKAIDLARREFPAEVRTCVCVCVGGLKPITDSDLRRTGMGKCQHGTQPKGEPDARRGGVSDEGGREVREGVMKGRRDG